MLAVTSSTASVPATSLQAFMPRVSPATLRYSHIKYVVYFLQSGFEILAAYLFLQLGLAKALRTRAERNTGSLFGQLLIFVPVFYVFIFLARLPLNFYSSFWLEHSMHLSDQPFWSWFEERLKFLALNIATELPLWLLLFFSLKRLPKAWPYLIFGVSLPLIVLAVFAAPIVFDPVFNDFTLMPKSLLRDHINALATKAGLSDAAIYISNHSKQSKKINAYVTGIGASARIVLWDTTVQKLPADEVLAILAHELGHHVLSHINCGCVIAALFSLCMLPFNLYCTPALVRRLPRAWQIHDLTDIALIPVVVLASFTVSFLGDPIINSYSRRIEHEADAYGLELTGNGPAMARLFVALSEQNLSEPDPSKFIEFWYFSHPSLKERIQFALSKRIDGASSNSKN
jgi:Zn-dependent protease with chaperone function